MVEVVEAEEGLRVRARGRPFSVSVVGFVKVDGFEEDQAMEKGWEVQRPSEGMVRKRCWPGWKVQGRATERVTRTASPGSASIVAFVPPLPTFR